MRGGYLRALILAKKGTNPAKICAYLMGALQSTHMGTRKVPIGAARRDAAREKEKAANLPKDSDLNSQNYHPKGDSFDIPCTRATHVYLMCTRGVHIWGPLVPIEHRRCGMRKENKSRHDGVPIGHPIWGPEGSPLMVHPMGAPYGHL